MPCSSLLSFSWQNRLDHEAAHFAICYFPFHSNNPGHSSNTLPSVGQQLQRFKPLRVYMMTNCSPPCDDDITYHFCGTAASLTSVVFPLYVSRTVLAHYFLQLFPRHQPLERSLHSSHLLHFVGILSESSASEFSTLQEKYKCRTLPSAGLMVVRLSNRALHLDKNVITVLGTTTGMLLLTQSKYCWRHGEIRVWLHVKFSIYFFVNRTSFSETTVPFHHMGPQCGPYPRLPFPPLFTNRHKLTKKIGVEWIYIQCL